MEKSLIIEVPITPPSVNHSYRPVIYTGRDGYPHRGRMLTKEAKAFREAVAIFAQGRKMIDAEAYHVTVKVWLGYRQRLDAGNAEKNCGDGLQAAGVFQNDSRVKHYEIFIDRDWDNPRTQISIEVMNQTEQQRSTKTNGKVSSSRMREGIQRQLGPSLSHGNGSSSPSKWRSVAGEQYSKAKGEHQHGD